MLKIFLLTTILTNIINAIPENVPTYDMSLNYFETIINHYPNVTITKRIIDQTSNKYVMLFYHNHICYLQARFYDIDHNLIQIIYYENCKIIAQVYYRSFGSDHSRNTKYASKHITDTYAYNVYYEKEKPYFAIDDCPNRYCKCVIYNRTVCKRNKNTTPLLSYFLPDEIVCELRNETETCFKNEVRFNGMRSYSSYDN